MKRHRQSSRAAFLMIELLMVIIVLSIFGLVASRLFTSVMKLNYNASVTHSRTVGFDAALRMLRADVWTASELGSKEGVISVTTFEGGKVDWSVDEEGAIVRKSHEGGKESVLRWAVDVPGAQLELDTSGVVLNVPQSAKTNAAKMHFISQKRMAEGRAS